MGRSRLEGKHQKPGSGQVSLRCLLDIQVEMAVFIEVWSSGDRSGLERNYALAEAEWDIYKPG